MRYKMFEETCDYNENQLPGGESGKFHNIFMSNTLQTIHKYPT